MMQDIKGILFDSCKEYTQNRIKTAEQALHNNREALVQDSKSSAGDKFETTREMLQQEIIRNESLLQDATNMQNAVDQIDIKQPFINIQNGCLVETDLGIFFFAIAIGKLTLQNNDYFIISINSPLGKAFRGKKIGDKIDFNGVHYKIKNIY